MAVIRVGIGGWTFPPWRGAFYPPGLPHAQELAHAARRLTAIEINGTFYRHQAPESFAGWAGQVPEGFVFAVKAHRATTHGRDLTAAEPAIARFLASGLAELGPKLGPILWQFPPTRRFDPATLAGFLALLPSRLAGLRLRHAIEARHPSFADAAAVRLLRRAGVAQGIVDSDKQGLAGDLTADFVYARLQRNSEAAPEGYEGAALGSWSERCRCWRDGVAVGDLPLNAPAGVAKARDVFAFFIGGDKVRAPAAAIAMLARLNR